MVIKELTKEQWDSIPSYIEESVAQSSVPTDKTKAESSIKAIYKNMGEEEPIIIWGRSQAEAALLTALCKKNSQLDSQLFSQLREQLSSQLREQLDSPLDSQLRSQLYSQLYSQLFSQLREQLREQLDSQLSSQLREQLSSQLREQLGSQLDSQLSLQLRSQLFSQLREQLYSQLDSQLSSQLDSQLSEQLFSQLRSQLDLQLDLQLREQLYSQLCEQLPDIWSNMYTNIWWRRWSYYYTFAKNIGVQFNEEKLEIFSNLVNEVDCIIPYKGIVFMSEKPLEIHWQDGRLHNENGAAVKYADGYSLYSITGVRVDEQIVMKPETLTVKQIQEESNQEKRRIMINRYGAGKYLEDINAKLIDVDMRGVHGAGPRALMEEPNGNQWLVATDGSTNRVYHLFVGTNNKTCRQAHELICGFSEDLIKAEG